MTTSYEFPCTLTIDIPFPTHRLASAAIRTLSVDQELSPLVRRDFSLHPPSDDPPNAVEGDPLRASLLTNAAPTTSLDAVHSTQPSSEQEDATVLRTIYRATTNRMLRVSVNGFFESLNVVLQVMQELDVDVLQDQGLEGLEGAQGVEQGMIGTTKTGA
ncbi:hypothetical protein D6C77_01892 [Aureobasidium pullulans]|uniref:Pcc1-domain-containing protein n=1 Tax=Aureobasidium pullulans TaxID=5580 RepID=A0A4S8YF29_AURPU|nr:hypothetical protein D6D27_00287 [Aureobasidium pullulans]THW24287.1 hypothetical protein D6D23_05315 [Aureobasidium pullulans]THW49190.1 hypothetical protein D6D21_02576 [Aureobasidium pullulans]THW92474.1 hypothetical protein D6D15_03155 [Aureobasidium pullulans]THW95041.1 hypothetical protein D6D18_05832 [Aureobasidium pullulans]